MKISIFGLGYVGAVTAGCFAADGHQVLGVDPVAEKVELMNRGQSPIVEAEIERYGEDYKVFSRAQGGVTGLWQVSGRSSTSYNERVMLDSFYVQNWSIWLDLAILIRTIGAVLLRKGAV